VAGAVHTEVVVQGLAARYDDAKVVRAAIGAGQLAVVYVGGDDVARDLTALSLDPGEVETLHLAYQERADLVLVDDMSARREARTHGLVAKGTLGVLLDAFRSGILTREDVRRFVRAIMDREDIWIASELCEGVLAALEGR